MGYCGDAEAHFLGKWCSVEIQASLEMIYLAGSRGIDTAGLHLQSERQRHTGTLALTSKAGILLFSPNRSRPFTVDLF